MNKYPQYEDLAVQFDDLIKPRREAKTKIDDLDQLKFVLRAIRNLEWRTTHNPELLPQIKVIADRLSEVISTAIAANALRYDQDPRSGASMMECARVMGITKQSGSERFDRGVKLMLARLADAGVVRMADHWETPDTPVRAEATRERHAVEAAQEYAVARLDEYRARHSRVA